MARVLWVGGGEATAVKIEDANHSALGVLLRLHSLVHEELEIDVPEGSLPLVLVPLQARRIARELLDAAEQMELGRDLSPRPH